jgi:hypothetical protein
MALSGWESAGGSRRVLLDPAAVEGLRILAIEGFCSLPKRGVEVGGVLYGRVEGRSVVIESYEEAPCEHRYGPSYALSDADRERLSEMLAARRDPPLPIGFFRSFTSRDPLIEAADEEFVTQHFPRGDFFFLLLQPLSPEKCVAGFRFFRDGVLLPDTGEQSFEFESSAMPRMEMEAPPPPPLATAASTDAASTAPVLPPAYRTREDPLSVTQETRLPPSRHMHWWIPALACLVLGVGGAFVYELWKAANQPRWVELHMDARPAGDQLQVTWDGNAPRVLNASRALLSVSDGAVHRDIELTPAQVRSGNYQCTPSRGDMIFRLILYRQGVGVAGDSVRVNSLAAAIPPAPPVLVKAPADADRTNASPVPAPPAAEPARVLSPPSTVHEVMPVIPEGIRSRIHEQIIIPVNVTVNESGRVTHASALPPAGSDGLHRYLAEQAQKTAWQWRFTPARARGGTRVAADKTIHFVFTP